MYVGMYVCVYVCMCVTLILSPKLTRENPCNSM